MRSTFHCPMGITNVWERNPLKGGERVKGARNQRQSRASESEAT